MSKISVYAKHCSKCYVLMFATDYGKDTRSSDGLRSSCRSCQNEVNLLSKKKYPERQRQYRSLYIKRNPEFHRAKEKRRRARLKGASLYRVTKLDLAKILRNPCFYCGSTIRMTIDHVIPLSRGGSHSIGNLVAACKACNSQKRQRFVTEWNKERFSHAEAVPSLRTSVGNTLDPQEPRHLSILQGKETNKDR
jgi:5-methylcytosine-specific restriction endonuclease McrA